MMNKKVLLAMLAAGTICAAAMPVSAEAVTEAESEALEAVTEGEEAVTEGEDAVELPEERPTYTALDYVELGEYKGLPLEVEKIVVTDDEVTAYLEAALRSNDIYDIKEEGVVEDGDIVNIDYTGTQDGVAFEGGSATGADLVIGSGSFIEGFEEGLIGVEIGDETVLELTFPEDYWNTDLAGAAVEFTVKVNSVKVPKPVSDEAVSELSDGQYSTVDEISEVVRTQLTAEKENQQIQLERNELLTQLYNTCVINGYPEDAVNYSVEKTVEYFKSTAETSGMTYEDMLAMYGMDEESFRLTVEEDVKASMDQELILNAIFEQEKLELTDAEIDEAINVYSTAMGYGTQEEFLQNYTREDVALTMRMSKAMDLVRENAVVTEVEPAEETESISEEEAVTEAVTE